jgi:hypothetical protein
MYIVDLECTAGHSFEGWYDSSAEYEELAADDEVTCPLCDGSARRVPSASRISTATTRGEKAARTPAPLDVQKELAKVVQHVRRTHEDVGEQFATRALAMHRGEEDTRPIRGTSTDAEEAQLKEEGVPFAKLPIPDIEQN